MDTETKPIDEQVVSGDMAQTGYGLKTKGKPSAVDARGLSGKTTDEEMKTIVKKKKKKKKVAEGTEEFPGFKKLRIKEGVEIDLDDATFDDMEEFPTEEDEPEEEIVTPCGVEAAPTDMASDTVAFVTDLSRSIKEIEEKLADMRYKLTLVLSKKK